MSYTVSMLSLCETGCVCICVKCVLGTVLFICLTAVPLRQAPKKLYWPFAKKKKKNIKEKRKMTTTW